MSNTRMAGSDKFKNELTKASQKKTIDNLPDHLDANDPLVRQAHRGKGWGVEDQARYDKLKGGGSSKEEEQEETGGGSLKEEESRNRNQQKYGNYGNVDYKGPTFASKAIEAAKKTNPVDFKALDQRIHDRPLYTQAKADIKHSEIFGDTWSWDSAPKWNTKRFQSEPMENRYSDVMKDKKNKDDD